MVRIRHRVGVRTQCHPTFLLARDFFDFYNQDDRRHARYDTGRTSTEIDSSRSKCSRTSLGPSGSLLPRLTGEVLVANLGHRPRGLHRAIPSVDAQHVVAGGHSRSRRALRFVLVAHMAGSENISWWG